MLKKDKFRVVLYSIIGVAGLLYSIHTLISSFEFTSMGVNFEKFVFLFLVGLFLLFFGLVNLCTAYAFLFGRVDRASGAAGVISLFRKDCEIVRCGKVNFVKKIDVLSREEDEPILFVCNWRPWVCRAADFHYCK